MQVMDLQGLEIKMPVARGFTQGLSNALTNFLLNKYKTEDDNTAQAAYRAYKSKEAQKDRDLRTGLSNAEIASRKAIAKMKYTQDKENADRKHKLDLVKFKLDQEKFKLNQEKFGDDMPIEMRQALLKELQEINYLSSLPNAEPLDLDIFANRKGAVLKQLGFSDDDIKQLSPTGTGKLQVFKNVSNATGIPLENIIGNVLNTQPPDSTQTIRVRLKSTGQTGTLPINEYDPDLYEIIE